MSEIIRFILHFDTFLQGLISAYGSWVYGILFVIVFLETGFVVTPFLPGDSLLFAAGAFASAGSLDIWTVFGLLLLAAIAGDNVNYWVGHFIGEKIFREDRKILKKSYLDRTHAFYEKYGTSTIIIARFVPIIRTISPFVAGVGRMTYRRFVFFDVIGGLLWVSLFVLGGFFFGQMSFVKNHFSVVVLAIICVSLLPAAIEIYRHKRRAARSADIAENSSN